MTARRKTIELRPEDQAFVARMVDRGEYGSADEVVSAALQAMKERNEDFERMVRKEVLPALDHLLARPETARTSEQVMARIREHHQRRTGGR